MLTPLFATLYDSFQISRFNFVDDIDAVVDRAYDIGMPAIIITTSVYSNGAASIFYPNVLKKVSEKFGYNLYILPSSVHECILLPDNGDYDKNVLKDMVISINDEAVSLSDKLSDNVYYYDKELDTITMA